MNEKEMKDINFFSDVWPDIWKRKREQALIRAEIESLSDTLGLVIQMKIESIFKPTQESIKKIGLYGKPYNNDRKMYVVCDNEKEKFGLEISKLRGCCSIFIASWCARSCMYSDDIWEDDGSRKIGHITFYIPEFSEEKWKGKYKIECDTERHSGEVHLVFKLLKKLVKYEEKTKIEGTYFP